MVTDVEWLRDPPLDHPVVIAAFSGWDDAGDAASTALSALVEALAATPIATLDSEEFYTFSSQRPEISTDGDGEMALVWPSTTIWYATTSRGTDLLLIGGDEPQLRWRTYCSALIDAAVSRRARLILTLGSILADIPHTRDTPVYGDAYAPAVCEALGFERGRNDGPAGIAGVIHTMCQQSHLNSASLWAAVPSYVSATSSPKAALALARRVVVLLGIELDLDRLSERASVYETEVDDAVSDDAETRAYLTALEESFDNRQLADRSRVHLIEEVEQFLREH